MNIAKDALESLLTVLQRSPFDVNFQYLFELKFCKKKDKDWQQKKEQGIEQIKNYLQLSDITSLISLKSYLIIANGNQLEMIAVSVNK